MLFMIRADEGELRIVEVEVEKESEKQYRLGQNRGKWVSRAVLNKTDLDKNLGYSSIQIFTTSKIRGLLLAKELLSKQVEQLKKKYQNNLTEHAEVVRQLEQEGGNANEA